MPSTRCCSSGTTNSRARSVGETCGKITVAQVHEDVYAAGLMLMWACGRLVAAEDTKFAASCAHGWGCAASSTSRIRGSRTRKMCGPMASEGNRMPDPIGFTGQAIVVTGAGRGLGRLYALDLAGRGAQVLVNDVGASMSGSGTDASVADGVVAEIQAAGGYAIASHDSVDTPEGGEAIIKAALSSFGRLDAVVSNAGIYEMTPFEDLSTEQWRRMLQVHLDGTFYLCQPAFRVMKEQGYGRLVLVASNIGAFGQEHAVHYGAAKGGIIGLTNGLANEGAPHGILANAVLPVGRTRMMTDSISDQHRASR